MGPPAHPPALQVADDEFKGYMTTELLKSAARFAPDRKWHVDTALRVLTTTGSFLTEDNITTVVRLFSDSPQLQGYIVKQLYAALKASFVVQPLTQIGVWCIGEYGDMLLAPDASGSDSPSVGAVLDLMQAILNSTVTGRNTVRGVCRRAIHPLCFAAAYTSTLPRDR